MVRLGRQTTGADPREPVGRDVNWDERAERQVGAAGIRDVRRMLEQSREARTQQRRQRTSAALLVAGSVAVVGLSLVFASVRPQPLPPGAYVATFSEGPVEVVVEDDGSVVLEAPASVEVDLEYSTDGQVLDAFTVATDDGAWSVEVEVGDDGAYAITTTPASPGSEPAGATGDDAPTGAPSDGGVVETTPEDPAPSSPADGTTTPPADEGPDNGAGGDETDSGEDPPQAETGEHPGQGHGPDDNPGQDHRRDDPPRVGTEDNPGQGHGPDDNPGRAGGPRD